jgi:hypothetical protein
MDSEHADAGRVGASEALDRIIAAMTELGQATTRDIATRAAVPYSSTTPKLRALQERGTAERVKVDGRTLWQLTAAGDDQDAADPQPESVHALPDGERSNDAGDDGPPSAPLRPVANRDEIEQPPASQATTPGPVPAQPGDATATEPGPAATEPDEPQPAEPATPQPGRGKRPKGALRAAALKVLRDQPDRQFRVSEVCKLIDQADARNGWSKASPGAVVNDLNKLAGQNIAQRTNDQPATYQAV